MMHPDTPTSSLTSSPADTAAGSATQEEKMVCLKTMKAFSELLESEDIPTFIRERIVLQVGTN